MENDKESLLTIKEIAELFNVPEFILDRIQLPAPNELNEITAKAQKRLDEFAIEFLLFYESEK